EGIAGRKEGRSEDDRVEGRAAPREGRRRGRLRASEGGDRGQAPVRRARAGTDAPDPEAEPGDARAHVLGSPDPPGQPPAGPLVRPPAAAARPRGMSRGSASALPLRRGPAMVNYFFRIVFQAYRWTLRPLCRFLWGLELVGSEHVRSRGPLIVAAN